MVVSEDTKESWNTALAAIEKKYQAKWPGQVRVITYKYSDGVEKCLLGLCEGRPAYTCFLAHHSECSRNFVSRVHRLTRKIDPSNPFTDTIWGILTGSSEDDVLFAINQEDLVVRRGLGGTPINLQKFESGRWYSEGEMGVAHQRNRGEKPEKITCPNDATEVLARDLSEPRDVEKETGFDMLFTSGHASERDWSIGYSFKSGRFVCQSGDLIGKSLDGGSHLITSNGRPKILSACGNCLLGHIDQPNCMALVYMHSVGVVQMVAYTVSTWFGYMGWGVHNYFITLPGMFSFAESFFANNQSLLATLRTKYKQYENAHYEECYGVGKECSGLLYDKDSVAFYGDPAYDARLLPVPPEELGHTLMVDEMQSDAASGWKTYRLTVTVRSQHGRLAIYLYPSTVREYKLLEGEAFVTCRFVLVPIKGADGKEVSVLYAVRH